MRLDKYLADMGIGTRSQVKDLIRKRSVQVNGAVQADPGFQVQEDDRVDLEGKEIIYEEFEYFMLNKPKGVVSATEDTRYPTVLSLIHDSQRKDLFPVGRLDLDTEGLLLITNDGSLAHRLLSPNHHVDKTYLVTIAETIPASAKSLFEKGVELYGDGRTMPAKLEILTEHTGLLTIQEGKYHQVKRMFAAIGCKVIGLKRISMGPLTLDESLEPGQYRRLTAEEREELRKW